MWWALLEVGILLLLVAWIVWMVKPPKIKAGVDNKKITNHQNSEKNDGKKGQPK